MELKWGGQSGYSLRDHVIHVCAYIALAFNSIYYVLDDIFFPNQGTALKILFAVPQLLILVICPFFLLSRKLHKAAFIVIASVCLLGLAADMVLVVAWGSKLKKTIIALMVMRLFVFVYAIHQYFIEKNGAGALEQQDMARRTFVDRRADFLALRNALRFLPVRRIGKELPDASVTQEVAGWQVSSRDVLPADALARLGDALAPLADVLYGAEMQAPFTYFYVSPTVGGGRACVCYSLDGTEPTEHARDLRPIEPHWFALRFG